MALDGERHPATLALREARQRVLEELSGAFADDVLSLDEFERRVDAAHAAVAEPELRALTADLGVASPLVASPPATALARPGAKLPGRGLARAVFGSVERRVSQVPERSHVLAAFGNVELDLRDLELPAGVTELEVRAVFGNVELTIPPTLAVECAGVAVFGAFSSVHRIPESDSSEPVLRIVGSAVFGNVEVKTLPAEKLLAAGAARRLPPARRGPAGD